MGLRIFRWVFVVALLSTGGPLLPAQQDNPGAAANENRAALVIGNAYNKEGNLANPAHDARAMAWHPRTLGFKVVPRENLTLATVKEPATVQDKSNTSSTSGTTPILSATAPREDAETRFGNDLAAPGTAFRDCPDCPEMVVIPAGKFDMGSPADEAGRSVDEGPVHSVTIARSFAAGKFKITRAQFARFALESGYASAGGCFTHFGGSWKRGASASWRDPGFPQTENDPVVCVNWNDAKAYAEWLTKKSGKRYRLLTEAEREYAARAGTQTARPWGDNANDACRYANVADAMAKRDLLGDPGGTLHDCDDGHAYAAPVGSYQPNAFGLYDMIGNAWEWTEDCWNANYEAAPADGSAWASGECDQRVLRGGSWFAYPQHARSANRGKSKADSRNIRYFGFRVARAR